MHSRFFGTQVHYGPEKAIDVPIGPDTFYFDETKACEAAKNLSLQVAGKVIVWSLRFSELGAPRQVVCLVDAYQHGNPTR